MLPIVEVDEPLRAYKYAEVRGATAPRVHPSGRYWQRSYEHRDATAAVCHKRSHQAPQLDCSCGFHAVPSLQQLPDVTEHHHRSVVLEVELGGVVMEHEHGLRAEQQTVLAALFPATCHRCDRPATHLRRGRIWRSSCTACAAHRPHEHMNRAQATAELGVEVGFADAHRHAARGHRLHVLRAWAMVALVAVAAAYMVKVPFTWWLVAGMATCVAAATALAAAATPSRLPRTRETLFQLQCLSLGLAAFLLVLATP